MARRPAGVQRAAAAVWLARAAARRAQAARLKAYCRPGAPLALEDARSALDMARGWHESANYIHPLPG